MDCQRVSMILNALAFASVPLHGQLSQSARLGALAKFKSGGKSIMVATDVASRCGNAIFLSIQSNTFAVVLIFRTLISL